MKTVKCKHCKSVMGLVRETPRWELYKCFSCRHVMGQVTKKLKRHELEDATREMDTYAKFLMGDVMRDIGNRLKSMSSEELDNFFKNKDK